MSTKYYGIYRCEICHAEFITLQDKFEHIKRFHSGTKSKNNMFSDFRQSVLYEYLEWGKLWI